MFHGRCNQRSLRFVSFFTIEAGLLVGWIGTDVRRGT